MFKGNYSVQEVMVVKTDIGHDAVFEDSSWMMASSNSKRSDFAAISRRRAWRPLVLVGAIILLVYNLFWLLRTDEHPTHKAHHDASPLNHTTLHVVTSPDHTTLYPAELYAANGSFDALFISGFDNSGKLDLSTEYQLEGPRCASLAHTGVIGVQKSFDIDDDLRKVALALDQHSVISYTADTLEKTTKFRALVERTWTRFGNSCAWLAEYEVFFCVTRIVFKQPRLISSFARAQIFDRAWHHLDGYELQWNNQTIDFPRMLEVPIELRNPLRELGPEDPRVIIEDGVEGAEPVLVFNMISSKTEWRRAMWLFRPFSQHSTVLKLRNGGHPMVEKNWAPLFIKSDMQISESESKSLDTNGPGPHIQTRIRTPSTVLHFVYNFKPLRVLECNLLTGICDLIFNQRAATPQPLLSRHSTKDAFLRGGTNWVPVPLRVDEADEPGSNVQAFVSFPRTHSEHTNCNRYAVYRPELVIMLTNSTHFYITYASESIDFGNAALFPDELQLTCETGRVLIVNSIARWEVPSIPSTLEAGEAVPEDIMTITFSVADETSGVLRISGLLKFIHALPSLGRLTNPSVPTSQKEYLFSDSPEQDESYLGTITPFMRYSSVGHDIRGCLEDASMNYISSRTKPPALRIG